MASQNRCPQCGASISAPGQCPACLMKLGLDGTDLSLSRQGPGVSVEMKDNVLDTIAQAVGPVPRVLLRDTSPGETPGPIVKPDTVPADSSIRYRIDGEIARGGMGAVLKGRDPDLGRDVALKVLRDDYRDDPNMVRRFVEEAQIGGQLQHPGVVPIYELGTMSDRRPFFSMKLVKGQTLAALLVERSNSPTDLPRCLSIFEAVCQTMAYAHARGVIHRDLKPSNVMVGSFGEVQVMDWGLAKVLPRGGMVDDATAGKVDRDATVIATARSGERDSDLSHAGSVMGTPAYMSPEQARGDLDQIDERSDVFALGSILCEILTGQPAFTGRNSGEIQRKAGRGDVEDALARLASCAADGELMAVARDCLAPERDDRPRDASIVAERIAAYLTGVQDRLRRSEVERATAQARVVEERKRRLWQVGMAASLLALSVVGGLSWTYWLQQRQARAATADRILSEARTLLVQAQAAPTDLLRWQAARTAVRQIAASDLPAESRGRLEELSNAIERGAAAAQADDELLGKLVEIRLAASEDGDGGASDDAYAETFHSAGLDIDALGPEEAGVRIRSRPQPIALALATGLDNWAVVRHKARPKNDTSWKRIVATARVADPDPIRNEVRSMWELAEPKTQLERMRKLATEASVDSWSPPTLNSLAQSLESAGDVETAVTLLRRAAALHSTDLWVNSNLAMLLEQMNPPRMDEAIRYYTAARALRPESAHDLAHALERAGKTEEAITVFRDLVRLRPTTGRHWVCLGGTLKSLGRLEDAIAALNSAESILRETVNHKPDDYSAHNQLGLTLTAQNRLDAAVKEFREAIRLRPDRANAFENLGRALSNQGKFAEGEVAFRSALSLSPNRVPVLVNLGFALCRSGKYHEAEKSFREAIRVKPGDPDAIAGLGSALSMQGKGGEAIADLRGLIRQNPDNPEAHLSLAIALGQSQQWDEANASFREAIRLKPGIAEAHCSFGVTLWYQGRHDESAAELREALRLDPNHVEALSKLGVVLESQGKTDEAIAACREAVRLQPDDPANRARLGLCLARHGKEDEADAEFREVIRLYPEFPGGHFGLGQLLSQQGKADEAIAEMREGVRLEPSNPESRNILGQLLINAGDFAGAIIELREAIKLKSNDSETHKHLGWALINNSQPDEAIPILREAVRLKPDYSEAWACLGVALTNTRKYDEAAEVFRKMIRGKPNDAIALYNLGVTLGSSGKNSEAADAYREVIRIKPDYAEAYCNLGMILRTQGDFAGSLSMIHKGHELGSAQPAWRYPSKQWVSQAERFAGLAQRMEGIQNGAEQPGDNAERLTFAQMFYWSKQYATAAQLWSDALVVEPKIAEDRQASYRYNAACAAALAAAQHANDEQPSTENEKLRNQALAHLQAELEVWDKLLESANENQRALVSHNMNHWRNVDPDLVSVRDPDALARLPKTEREQWNALWARVDKLIGRAKKAP